MTIWYTADPHFGHEKVAEIRGFEELYQHDWAVMDAWRPVQPDDVVYILGDLCVSKLSNAYALQMLKMLPGTKHLIFGNHDSGHPMHSTWTKHHEMYREVFDTVSIAGHIKSAKQKVLLSHFPYSGEGDREGERYPQWRLRDEGALLIHGHTHSNKKYSVSSKGTPQLHVGLDAWDMNLVHEKYVHDWVREHSIAD